MASLESGEIAGIAVTLASIGKLLLLAEKYHFSMFFLCFSIGPSDIPFGLLVTPSSLLVIGAVFITK